MVENDQSGEMKKNIAHYCFKNLTHFLKTREILPAPAELSQYKYPLFVTWQKDGDLRGCIGTFAEDAELGETLSRYSLIAAVQDSRFPPINESELPQLRCEVSLLSTFEKIDDPLDWEVGKHGIEIEFKDDKVYRGTFLPNVAPEQGWNQVTTLEYLCRKAGYTKG